MADLKKKIISEKDIALSKMIERDYIYYVIVVTCAAIQLVIIGIPISYIFYSFFSVLLATIVIVILKFTHLRSQVFTNKIYLSMLFIIALTLSFYYKDLQLTLLIGNSFLLFNLIVIDRKFLNLIISILLINITNLSYILLYPASENIVISIVLLTFVVTIAIESKILIQQLDKITQKYIKERKNREKLENINKDKDEFISTISHELRSPMTAIRGYLQLLNIEPQYIKLPKETLTEIEDLYNNTENLNKLIDNLLNSSRIDLGRLYINKKDFPINTIIIKAIDRVIQNANKKNIKIKLNSRTNNITINTDPEKLQDVIVNLLDNSIKYSKEYSVIHVISFIQNKKIIIKVKDHGMGISINAKYY
ncbi:HAMP domain-containing histidine kinase, partial [Patescibacteria group bacterium]|nr:HAMP domain-containing histidine kinase [Patescibacteria group bacterium]